MAKKSLGWIIANALIVAGLAALSVLPESMLGLSQPQILDAVYRAVYMFFLVLLVTMAPDLKKARGNGEKPTDNPGHSPNPAPPESEGPPQRLGMVI